MRGLKKCVDTLDSEFNCILNLESCINRSVNSFLKHAMRAYKFSFSQGSLLSLMRHITGGRVPTPNYYQGITL